MCCSGSVTKIFFFFCDELILKYIFRNENGEEQPCGKVFSRVPNCKRHMLVHAKQDPQMQEVGKVVQDLSVLHQLKEDDIVSNESDFAALQQSMDNTCESL